MELWHSPVVENLLLDVRYALRVLRKSPAFTLVTIVTLMLGIGANVVVFGVLNAVLLHSLDVSDPSSLYQIRHRQWTQGKLLTTSYPTFEDLQRRNATFSGMVAIYAYSDASISWRNTVTSVHGDEVSGNYFDLLGAQPALGRFFHAADEHGPGSAPYIVLSNSLWRTAFHADPGVIGTTVEIKQHPFTVVGVASPEFQGTERFVWPDYWLPMVNEQQVEGWDYLHNRTSMVTVIGRVKPGVTQRQATDDLNKIESQLANEYPQTDDGQPLRLVHPGLYADEGDVIRGFLWSITALALLVLAAACANLASLFAARASDRSRELALRVALGSSRRQLVRQLLTEAVLVSLAGGTAGLVAAYLLLGVLDRTAPFAGSLTVHVDGRVYVAALVLTLASALLFGMLPARQAWQSSPLQMMKGTHAQSTHLGRFALRDLLLGVQIAICTLLVTASLVAVRGMTRALHTPLGFQPQGAMLVSLDLSQVEQPDDVALEKEKAILEAMRDVPGVTAAAAVNRTPMTGGLHGTPIFPPGTSRRFILNANLTEVVGASEDGKYHDMQESPQPVVYLPLSQSYSEAVFIVRSRRTPTEMSATLQRTLSGIEPNVPITVQSWSDSLAGQLFPAKAATVALGIMGLLAAMLAVTGIFGMAAYSVSRRMKELGIRMALGARRTQVMSAAVGRPIVLLGVGSLLGLLAGILASRLLRQIVYQANPGDPAVLGGAVLTMALLGVVASALPARRALAIDPSKLMREE